MSEKQVRFSWQKLWRHFTITYEVIWNVCLIIFIASLCAFSFAFGVGAGYFASLVKDAEPIPYKEMKKDIYNYEETTHIYFANHQYLGYFRSDLERDEIKLSEVSPYFIQAIIATEDEHFYEHKGVVPKAIIRAIFQEATNSSTRSGGSTLTQQLVKNQILTNEVSFERKAKEVLLALRLEKFFSKDEILEAYINVVPFGRNASGRNIAGVQAAAKGVFGVDAKELTLPQAAFLAGLPQSPFRYTPFTSKGELKNDLSPALNRMKTVLSRMKKAGYISNEQYEEAIAYDITKDFVSSLPSPIEKYPWLTFEIERRAKDIFVDLLAKKDGYERQDVRLNDQLYREYAEKAEKQLRQNGYTIYTTIDKDIYERMQAIVEKYPYFGSDTLVRKKDEKTGQIVSVRQPVEVGAMLIENKTGRIISFVGGRDYKREQLNHATQAYRSNGSTMKPLLVYAPAMEMGIVQPGSVIPDVALEIPTKQGPYRPKNADGKTHGLTSVRHALKKSYNIPAIRTYARIIDQRPISYLEKMGFTSLTTGDGHNLSLALGGLTKGVTIEENVNAYATFANGGKFVDAYLIEKIVDKNGKVIYEHEPKQVEVFSPQTAYLTIDMMRDVIRSGTAAFLNGKLKFSADWAGKTGTSQNTKDAWFVATNPNVTFGIWMGYDTPKSLEKSYKGLSYSQRNLLLWAQLINGAYDIRPELIAPQERFHMPGGIVQRSYCVISGLLPSKTCKRFGLIESDLFNTAFVPKQEDQYLVSGAFVELNGERYVALPSTPREFTKEGVMIDGSLLEQWGIQHIKDMSQLLPRNDKWKHVFVAKTLQENGKKPDPLAVQQKGATLVWSEHHEQDVIGYRVYYAAAETASFQIITTIRKGEQKSVPLKQGIYYVTAVDIAGLESNPSNIIRMLPATLPELPINEEPTEESVEEQPTEEPVEEQPTTN